MPKKSKSLKFVTQKVKLFRSNDPVISVLMWGVNYSLSELNNATIPAVLLPEYFKAYLKVKVENCGFNKDRLPSNYKFKEYFPIVFHDLRDRNSISDEEYAESITKYNPQPTECKGKSSSKIYTSYDRKYIIKTISNDEVSFLHRFIPNYHQYMVKNQCDTLLCKYVGLYRITVNQTEIYMIIQTSCFPASYKIHKKFDLKGSTVSRQATVKEREKKLPTLKDNDFMNELTYIDIGSEARIVLLDKLKADIEFLRVQCIMDYSLLIGIHDLDRSNDLDEDAVEDSPTFDKSTTSFEFPPPTKPNVTSTTFNDSSQIDMVPVILETINMESIDSESNRGFYVLKGTMENHVYIMGIIDFITPYGMKKRTAHSAKTLKHGADAEISTVNPEQYAKRFINFVSKSIR